MPFMNGKVLASTSAWARLSIKAKLARASLGSSRLWPRLISRSATSSGSRPRSAAWSFFAARQKRTLTEISTPSRVRASSRCWLSFIGFLLWVNGWDKVQETGLHSFCKGR